MRLSRLSGQLSVPLALNVAAKAALAAVVLYYVARPDLPQFEGKAMTLRAIAFPLVALLLPALWLARGRLGPYPHLPDALLVWPAVVDAGGNAADFYRFEWFDHTVHFANMTMLAAAFALLLAARDLVPAERFGLALGFGAVLHTLWELTEWGLVELFGMNLDIEYVTTMRDFAAGLLGSALGAAAGTLLGARRARLGGRLLAPRGVPAAAWRADRPRNG